MKSLKNYRKHVLLGIDILVVIGVYFFTLILFGKFPSFSEAEHYFLQTFAPLLAVYIAMFLLFRIYDTLWRYAELQEFFMCMVVCLLSGAIFLTIAYFVPFITVGDLDVIVMAQLLITFFLVGVRAVYRLFRSYRMSKKRKELPQERVLLVGAGVATTIFLNEISKEANAGYKVACIVDDDKSKIGRKIHGILVRGNISDIPKLCKKFSIDSIIIAVPSASKKEMLRIIDCCAKSECQIKTLPTHKEIMDYKNNLKNRVRNVKVEDLLSRESITFDKNEIMKYIRQKSVLITGGGGSIGSELCRQVAGFEPEKLIILDICENGAFEIQQELLRKYGSEFPLYVEIASVRDAEKLDRLFDLYRPDVVFHAAAHKHVPLMENSPDEAVKNNIFGTLNTAHMADKYEVQKFVLISTDKAVNPTNIMGATKRFAEMIIQDFNHNSKTEFVAVRFGNVLGSNGSVIPQFMKQIESGGPVCVTHPDITRFFMTILEAVQLVIQAGGMAKGGEIFVLDMGEPVKIADLAKSMIVLSGLIPGRDIHIEYTGLRPGEKLYEEVLMDEEGLMSTANDLIKIGKLSNISHERILQNIEFLHTALAANSKELLVEVMQKVVPTYTQTKHESVSGSIA